MTQTKTCRKCGIAKPLSEFGPDKAGRLGVKGSCRRCTRPLKIKPQRVGWVSNGIGYIPLTQGKVAIVDEEEFETINAYQWFAVRNTSTNTFYAQRKERGDQVRMHRQVLGVVGDSVLVDHINHDTLDNRKSNLRIATDEQNTQNARRRRDNTSGYKGVTFNIYWEKYTARIQANGKRVFLGWFDSAEEASIAYVNAAKQLHGDFACLTK